MPAKGENVINRIDNGIAYIDISTSKYPDTETMIDETDIEIVVDGGTRWVPLKGKNTLYVVRHEGGRKGKHVLLHRRLLSLENDKQGDHKNGNGLDNRRKNLRPASHEENARNSRRRRNGTSSFLGVSWDADRGKWVASIRSEDKKGRQSLGRFNDEIEAARAYDRVAKVRYGEFANLNFGGDNGRVVSHRTRA